MPAKPQLLTPGEVAQAVGCFESRVRRMLIARPDLVILVGRTRCIDAAALPEVRELLCQTPAVAGSVEGV